MYKKAHNYTNSLPERGKKYRKYRLELELSASAVADMLGYSANTIYRLEYGHKVSPFTEKRIRRFYEKKLKIGKYAERKHFIKRKRA